MTVPQLTRHGTVALTLLTLVLGLAAGALASLRSSAESDASSADLSVAWSYATFPERAGEAVVYTLTVINAGPGAAASLTVTVTLPPALTAVAGWGTGWTCDDVTAGRLICTRSDLEVGAASDIVVMGISPVGRLLVSDASVSSTTHDPFAENNIAVEETVVMPTGGSADLSIAVFTNPDPVKAGFPLTYTLTVTNAGPDTSSGVTVTETLPVGVTTAS